MTEVDDARESAFQHAELILLGLLPGIRLSPDCRDCAWLIDHGYGRAGELPDLAPRA